MVETPPTLAITVRHVGVALALIGGLVSTVWAGCSRPIVVPVAPSGFNVITNGEKASGVFPDWLAGLGKRIGCTFEFAVVPRARADAMVLEGRGGDLLIPAAQNSERDTKATFIPLRDSAVALITVISKRGQVPVDVAALRASPWRAGLVRRYSFGDEYNALVAELGRTGRIDFVTDLETIERMLRAGRVDYTLLPATLMYSALLDGKPMTNAAEFQYSKLPGLPTSRGGAYLSANGLSPSDFHLLRTALAGAARDGSLRRAFEAYYPAEVIKHEVFLQ